MLPKRGDRYATDDVRQAIVDKLLESETLGYKEDPGGKLEAVIAKAVSASRSTRPPPARRCP